jgi:tetratricopeptide (TPR) repeat protein
MAKNPAEKKEKGKENRVTIPGINTSLNNAKVLITWIIIAAFIGTSGIVIGLGMFGRNETAGNTEQVTMNPQEEEMRRIDAEIEHWTKEVAADPQNANAYFNLGEKFQQKRDHEKAITNFKKALELKNESIIYRKYLAESYAAEKKYDDAMKTLEEAIKRSPDDHTLYRLAGSIYFQQGDMKKSEEVLKKALKLSPGEVDNYATLAFIQKEMGKDEEAKKSLSDGIEVAKSRKDERSAMIMTMMLEEFSRPKDLKPEDKPTEKSGDTGKDKEKTSDTETRNSQTGVSKSVSTAKAPGTTVEDQN